MRPFILIFGFLSISFTGFCQVNRYTAPPPVAQYNPMTFEDLKFAPSNKKQAADQNFQILQKIAYGLAEYIEKRGADDQLIEQLAPYGEIIENLAVSDLSNKRNDLVKLDQDLKKVIKNYEQRQASGFSDLYFEDLSGLFKVKQGALVVSKPIRTTTAEDAEPQGFAKSGEIKVVRKANENFYEIEFNGKKGYLSKEFLKIN
ncbi:MAG: hypothetical protein C0433_19150 [Cyclobacterium sp.]|nr:hypothetical protein [Cyclobacterium sp.]